MKNDLDDWFNFCDRRESKRQEREYKEYCAIKREEERREQEAIERTNEADKFIGELTEALRNCSLVAEENLADEIKRILENENEQTD